MLNIDILKDDTLQTAVNKFISSMLPHTNYNPSAFSINLNLVYKLIKLEEFSMEYYVLFSSLTQMNKVAQAVPGYEPTLSRSVFEDIISVSLSDCITSPYLRVEEWLTYEGQQSNLSIETAKQAAIQKLYERSMALYDTCFDLQIDSLKVVDFMPELHAAFIGHIAMQSINAQVNIVQGSMRLGRKVLTGVDDWLRYTAETATEIRARIDAESSPCGVDNVIELNSMESARVLLSSLSEAFEPLGNYGIPPLDDFTPMFRHRLAIIIGMENIGKTKFLINEAVNVLMANHKVAYMCGESTKGLVFAQFVVNYIAKKYQKFVLVEHVYDCSECPEDIQKLIHVTVAELIESKNLMLVDTFHYATVYDEMVNLYTSFNVDAIFIDHSFALTGSRDIENPVETLSKQCRAFKRNYPCYVCVASHPSAESKKFLATGKPVATSPTRGSATLGEEADETFILRQTESQKKMGIIALEVYKRRNASKPVEEIILKPTLSVGLFEYDPALQTTNDTLSSSAEEVLSEIEEKYSEPESQYSLI